MTEPSKLDISKQKSYIEDDEENIGPTIVSNEKNEDSFEIPVEIKTSEEQYYNGEEEDYEADDESSPINIQSSVRNGFIRKVYGLLSIQLIITFGFVLLFQIPAIKKNILTNIHLAGNILICSSISFLFLFLILACCRNLSRTVPYNFIFLFAITLCEALSCSIVSACYSFEIVAVSLFLTIISTLTITFYACTTKTDFSYLRVILYIISIQLFMAGITSILLRINILYMFYTYLSTIMVGIYLVYDTQLIMGKFGLAYSVDDYIFASLEIYIDIIRLFLLILRIVAQASKKN